MILKRKVFGEYGATMYYLQLINSSVLNSIVAAKGIFIKWSRAHVSSRRAPLSDFRVSHL